jgi:hypothetical protein
MKQYVIELLWGIAGAIGAFAISQIVCMMLDWGYR